MTVPDVDDGVGCRSAVLAALALLGAALAVGTLGLWLVLSHGSGLWLFYAAAPASALFGVIGGGLPIAWPLDIGIWLMLGVGTASWATRLRRPIWHLAAAVGVAALAYGLVLSQFVEVDQLA